ncbi:SRPBCC family protein [Knoellia sp. CPCC 206450]|uniref:SRPBCC family protein n=1 Tax=Knoellia tibetensis TaxID=3404798 RepID=UPI003B437956
MSVRRIALVATAVLGVAGLAAALLHREHRVERSVDIAATPDEVWATLTDFTAYGQWNPFIREVSGPVETGGRLTVTITPARGSVMTFTPSVLAADPGRELRWLGRVLVPGLLDGEHAFTLEALTLPDGTVGTRLTQSERFAGVLVPFLGGAIDVGDDFAAMNDALRDRTEAGATLGR